MDRRQALKKLGAGGAVAAGASLVLSSNPVAAAGSGPIIEVPPAPTVIYSYSSNALTITLTALPPTCSDGTPTAEYSWSNPSGTVQAQQIVTIGGLTTNPVVTLVRNGKPAPQNPWGTSDFFSVTVAVTWTCGSSSRHDTYTVQATINDPATVSPI